MFHHMRMSFLLSLVEAAYNEKFSAGSDARSSQASLSHAHRFMPSFDSSPEDGVPTVRAKWSLGRRTGHYVGKIMFVIYIFSLSSDGIGVSCMPGGEL